MNTQDLLFEKAAKETDAAGQGDRPVSFATLIKSQLSAFKDVEEAQGDPHRDFKDENVKASRCGVQAASGLVGAHIAARKRAVRKKAVFATCRGRRRRTHG